MDSDLQIAQRARLLPIQEITGRLGLLDDEVLAYGRYKAKVRLESIARLGNERIGKYIVVTGITPTPLGEETVIVRMSDHGELALSHGGLRQKVFNVYEETLRVPLIISNPHLCPQGRTSEHPASLLDLMPTLATLCGVEAPAGLRGADLTPIITDPAHGPVQDHVLFTYDDVRAGQGAMPEAVQAANRIRCIREARFKYARYFHADGAFPEEFELYDLQEDPLELENLAHPDHPRYHDPQVAAQRERLAAKLADAEARNARPLPA